MSKVGIALILVVLCMYGTASGQSLLDSVFGPSGLGVWGAPQAGQQFDDPRYYGGNVGADPNQQVLQPTQPGYPQGYDQQYPQQAYGYGQQPQSPPLQYYPQAPGQPIAPPQYGPPPVQAPPQGPASVQRPAPRTAAQPQRQRSAPQRAATAPPPQEAGGKFGDPLPPGAVRITTSTPEGTVVQYYPPSGAAEGEQTYAQRPRPRAASSRAPRTEHQATQAQAETPGRSSIAMPKPVPIPQGQDPRSGWTPNQ